MRLLLILAASRPRCSRPPLGSALGAEDAFSRTVVVGGLSTRPVRRHGAAHRAYAASTSSSSAGRFASRPREAPQGVLPRRPRARRVGRRAGPARARVRSEVRDEPLHLRRLHGRERGHARRPLQDERHARHPVERAHPPRVDQPYANHNGGDLAFGPDGRLYVGIGDGGSGGDPENRAQNMQTPSREDAAARRAAPRLGPEIVALGPPQPVALLVRPADRRPLHRRRRTGRRRGGRLHPEVGAPALENYGWDVYEGSRHFEDKAPGPGKLVFPVYEYTHDNGGCTVVGGFVYRGKARPAERGRYIFGDFCSGVVWSLRDREREGDRRSGRAFTIPKPVVVRRGRGGRALRHVATTASSIA